MFEKLEIFNMANGMIQNAAARHLVISENIANADTPNYRAADIRPFEDAFRSTENDGRMHATRSGHIGPADRQKDVDLRIDAGGRTSPNGNNVSLESEMMKATQVRQQHETALSIYSASLNILRTSIGRGR